MNLSLVWDTCEVNARVLITRSSFWEMLIQKILSWKVNWYIGLLHCRQRWFSPTDVKILKNKGCNDMRCFNNFGSSFIWFKLTRCVIKTCGLTCMIYLLCSASQHRSLFPHVGCLTLRGLWELRALIEFSGEAAAILPSPVPTPGNYVLFNLDFLRSENAQKSRSYSPLYHYYFLLIRKILALRITMEWWR